jgi:signal transduction histidine kinase/ligand-binding sensor domain-containing protein
MKRISLLAALLGAGLTCAAADEGEVFFARSWQIEDGLPENSVLGAARTPDGFLWVATQQGLLRFDGVRFRDFHAVTAAGRPTGYLEALLVDGKGRLWVAKNRGIVVCMENDRVSSYTVSEARDDYKATSMAQDADGAVWISYHKGQPVCRIHEGEVRKFGPEQGVSTGSAHLLAADRAGNLWFSRHGAIGLVREGRFNVLLRTPGEAMSLTAARDGGIWAGSGDHVYRYREGGVLEETARLPALPGRGGVSRLFEDRNGRLWVGTAGGRLFWRNGAGFSDTGLEGAEILSIADDHEGNLWVGTRVAGLNRIRPRALELLGRNAGWDHGRVKSVCVDDEDGFWVVGNNGLLARFHDDAWTAVRPAPDGVPVQAVCVARDPRGGVLVGTVESGLLRSDGATFHEVQGNEVLRRRLIRALHVDSDGAIWIGQENPPALRRWHEGAVTDFALPPGQHAPRAIVQDPSGHVWAATSDGALVRVAGGTATDESPRTLPDAPSIRSLCSTGDGSLWIGYAERGLGRIKDGVFFHYDRNHGLPGPYVSQILADDAGRLWLAGNRGVCCVSIDELDGVAHGRAGRFVPMVFGRDEGLPRFEASFDIWPNAARDRKGRLVFSTPAGLLLARPDSVFQSPEPPPVVIESVTANGKVVAAYHSPETGGGRVSLDHPNPALRLGPGRQQVEIEFTALRLAAPESVLFRYRLEGRDSAWIDVGTNRRVRFERLTAGDYRFEVRAYSNDGEWNETASRLGITVLPHLWETRWFQVLAGLGLLIGGGATIRLIERRRIQRRLERLEREHAVERERTRIARDLHDDLGASLTQIAMLSHFARSPGAPPEQARDDMDKVGVMARDLTRSLAEIVWAVNPRNDNIDSFVSYATQLAEDSLRAAGIRCLLDTDPEFPEIELNTELRHHLLMIVKEAIHNAIKHSGAETVWLRAHLSDGILRLAIEDDGRGMPADPSGIPGSGNGIANIQRRAASIGGRVTFQPADGRGTRVEVTLPLPPR